METRKQYDVLIVGGGVTGTGLLYTLSKYTNISRIGLIEKYDQLAQVNSKQTNNSQTLHFGDIETNYKLEKATKVKQAADMVRRYVEEAAKDPAQEKLFSKYHKMVLAVGDEQVIKLAARFDEFKHLFPLLRKIEKEEIGTYEPKVLEGRDPNESLLALFSPNGYTMDYAAIARSFAQKAQMQKEKTVDVFLGTKLEEIKKNAHGYFVKTNKGRFEAKVVMIAAGGHTLLIAKSLGYGKEYSILSIAGSFYFAPAVLNGKVYTMQLKKLPFAAIHGDPDVHDQSETRFGPTAKAIPLLERYNNESFLEYFKTFGFKLASFTTIIKVLSDPIILKFILRNFTYDIPVFGKRLFTKEIKKIIPSIKNSEVRYAKRTGGTRPQILNLKTKTLDMGEAKLHGDNIIFNITPSPGASTCLRNAYDDTKEIIKFFNGAYQFDEQQFRQDLID